jgi:hypothetical protein
MSTIKTFYFNAFKYNEVTKQHDIPDGHWAACELDERGETVIVSHGLASNTYIQAQGKTEEEARENLLKIMKENGR